MKTDEVALGDIAEKFARELSKITLSRLGPDPANRGRFVYRGFPVATTVAAAAGGISKKKKKKNCPGVMSGMIAKK